MLIGLTSIIPLVALWSLVDIHSQISTIEPKGQDLNTVILKSHKIKEGDYATTLIGQVQNNLGKEVNFVEIIATFYDQNGDIIGTDTTFTKPYDLRPNMKAPFEMYLEDSLINELNSYDLTIDWRNSDGTKDTKIYEFTSAKTQDKHDE